MQPITIILTDGYSDWEIGHLAGLGGAFFNASFHFVSPRGGALRSVAGLPIAETGRFEAQQSGVVVLCGGRAWEAPDGPDLSELLRLSFANGCTIAGICGGTIALARAGLLDAVDHTSNGPGYLKSHVRTYQGEAHYRDQPQAVSAGRIITAAAPAPASFAQEVLLAAGCPFEQARQVSDMLGREFAV